MKKLRVCGANDTFGALNLILDVLEGNCAGFISAPEVNGVLPEVFLPEEVADDVGLIVESSGSTGSPKQIELSVAALRHSASASLARLGGPGQWLLALTPQFIAGVNVLTRSVLSDSQPVIMNTQVPFTTEAFVRGASLMEGERRYTSLVPAQLQRIAAEVDSDAFLFSTLRKFDAILVGGQAADFALVESLRAKGINIILSYGMAETSGGCVYDGVALDGVAIKIVDGPD
jgi:O-succinylbenzoic acid--CoA ligase